MKTTNKIREERTDVKNYLDQINWDGLFLKIQLTLGGIFVLSTLVYFLLLR